VTDGSILLLLVGILIFVQARFLLRAFKHHLKTRHDHHTEADVERRVSERTSELCARNTALELQATTDSLTGITNRRGFMYAAAHEIRQSERYHRPFALLFIDLDQFKTINDTFGHAAGDSALRLVVIHMGRQLRDGDIMARIGGDEFVLLLQGTTILQAELVAKRLSQEIAAATTSALNSHFTTMVSVGVAEWRSRETIDQLLARADQALYQAKAIGHRSGGVALELPLNAPVPSGERRGAFL